MNLGTPLASRAYPTRGSPANTAGRSCRPPGSRGRTRLASWLIVPTLLVLSVAGASTATAARSTRPHPFSCSKATGARWHVKHFFFEYSHGAMTGARLPASGDRYTVSAGGVANCRLAHRLMQRLTSETPDRSVTGRNFDGIFIPPGYGYLFNSPQGYLCAATFDQTHPASEIGDNLHVGFCVKLKHTFAFLFTAATPSPYKLKPR